MSTKDLVYIALFAALMAVLGVFPPITLPIIAIPITAQSLGPMLAGVLIGAKRAGLSMLLFCLLVVIGLPLLSGGRGGVAAFVGPSAGFIYGWVISAYLIGLAYDIFRTKLNWIGEVIILLSLGIGVVYGVGITWLVFMGGLTFKVASVGMLVFLPGDMIKLVLTILVSHRIRRAYPTLHGSLS